MRVSVLVDTCLWIDHLRHPLAPLVRRLRAHGVVSHPCILGELVVGGLSAANRRRLALLPMVVGRSDAATLAFVDRHRLAGQGLGWTDCHLLAAAAARRDVAVWTRDTRLARVAAHLTRAGVLPGVPLAPS